VARLPQKCREDSSLAARWRQARLDRSPPGSTLPGKPGSGPDFPVFRAPFKTPCKKSSRTCSPTGGAGPGFAPPTGPFECESSFGRLKTGNQERPHQLRNKTCAIYSMQSGKPGGPFPTAPADPVAAEKTNCPHWPPPPGPEWPCSVCPFVKGLFLFKTGMLDLEKAGASFHFRFSEFQFERPTSPLVGCAGIPTRAAGAPLGAGDLWAPGSGKKD